MIIVEYFIGLTSDPYLTKKLSKIKGVAQICLIESVIPTGSHLTRSTKRLTIES